MKRLAIPVLVAGLALGGCPADPRDDRLPNVVAAVGGAKILRPAFVAELSRSGTSRVEDKQLRRQMAERVLERMVRQELLYQAAVEAGAKVDDHEVTRILRTSAQGYPAGMFGRVLHAEQLTLAEYKERVRRKALVDAYLKERFSGLPEPTEEELHARWDATVEKRPEAVRARQLLVKTEEEARYLEGEIKKGALTLEEAARQHSEAPEREEGGDLGWFSRGEMPPVFDACFGLEAGKVSDVVPSEYGFHMFQVIDKRAGGKEPFEHARRRLEAELRGERQEDALRSLEAELRKKSAVTVDDKALQIAIDQLPEPPDEEEVAVEPAPMAAGVPTGEPGAALEQMPRARELPERSRRKKKK
jgi:peptidyl-prolyl cis-trans isomerase C/foldase protein PrsA